MARTTRFHGCWWVRKEDYDVVAASLASRAVDWDGIDKSKNSRIAKMESANASLEAELADWRESAATASKEPCDGPDDWTRHCDCVGPLRKRVHDLEESLRQVVAAKKARALAPRDWPPKPT